MKRAALIVAILATLPGCGAVFHSSQKIEFVTRPQDKAVVYENGVPLVATQPGVYTKGVFLNMSSGAVGLAPGKRMKRLAPQTHVDGAAVVCDILWSLTIIGVAAPISDALLGTFTKTESPIDVVFEDDVPGDNPMPVYSVGGADIPATTAPPPTAAPPPEPPPSAAPPTPSPSSSSRRPH